LEHAFSHDDHLHQRGPKGTDRKVRTAEIDVISILKSHQNERSDPSELRPPSLEWAAMDDPPAPALPVNRS
jgi:hypothetical protein